MTPIASVGLAALQFSTGLVLGYGLASLAESLIHDHVHHARRRFLSLQKRYPRALGGFRNAHRSHAVVHHAMTYRDHVTRFRDEAHNSRVDNALRDDVGRKIIEEDYGTTLSWRSASLFLLPISPALVLAATLLSWPALAGFLLPVAAYPLLSMVIHPYLHMRHDEAVRRASAPLRWLLASGYMRFVWRHHWLHHRYPRYNFNLLIGGDWIRGVQRSPSDDDLREMRGAGMPVDSVSSDGQGGP